MHGNEHEYLKALGREQERLYKRLSRVFGPIALRKRETGMTRSTNAVSNWLTSDDTMDMIHAAIEVRSRMLRMKLSRTPPDIYITKEGRADPILMQSPVRPR